MKKFNMRRALKGTLFAMVLSLSVPLAAFGEEADGINEVREADAGESLTEGPLSLDVTYGYQNTAKSGRFLPLSITIDNHTEEEFKGSLCVKAMEPDFRGYSGQVEYDTYQYEYPIEIPASGRSVKSVSISLGPKVDQMYLGVVDESGKEILRKRLKLNLNVDMAELFIGVLSDTPDRLTYFNNAGINYSTLRTRTIEMTPETLPATELGLDQLDVLLITNFDTGKLSGQQTEAVWEWVQDGGLLLLGTGERGSDTLRAFSSQLLEYPVPQPGLYEVNMGVEYAVDGPEGATIPLTCTEVSVKGGSEFFSSDALSVLSGVTVGNGMAAVAIYDFKDIEEFCQENRSYIDRLFTTLLGEDKINQLLSAVDSSTSSQFWAVQGLINTGDVNKLPRVELYVILALAYVGLAGPGLYFFLKQRELSRYYQPVVALLSICCTGMVLLMGTSTRFTGPFFTYATIRDGDSKGVEETTYINMRAPYNRPYSVEIDPSYTMYPITGSLYYNGMALPWFTGEEEPSVAIRYGEDCTRITADSIGAFHSKYFRLERHQDHSGEEGFTGTVNAFEGEVTGTLTNNFGQAVEDVAVLLYNQIILVGSMEPGETVDLADIKPMYGAANFGYAMAAQITGASRYRQNGDISDKAYVEALERTNLLSFYIERYLSAYHTEAQVVGFGRDKEETQFLKKPVYETYGCTLLTSSIDVDYERDGYIYRTAMQKQPHVLSGDYYAANNTIYGLTPVILEYYLGNDMEVDKLDLIWPSEEVKENLRYYYTVPFEGGMYFYNYNTGNYDSVDISVAEYSREKLEPYLSPGNTLTVKYIYDTAGDYTWNIVLPVLTVTGRSK
ncbi:hypothetical protein [Lacrimispora sp. 210928-DFI.3.58]|uniref:hypothetical protein n=1 Tax=Lacrimispora sp. 210928-DFI.3.58 TaxID=2883214 RepID=UPI001D096A28|nr:hypothetical protein [Lacrimispora sp. 210928-DFI.3.58]MCB7319216.1 hypothetical protein [Lacrimispora sp. 210928-DFI.3.58]